MKKYFLFLILLAVLLLTLGCISSPEKKTETLSTLRIGYQPTTHHVAEMVAANKSWWLEDLKPFGIKEIKEFGYPSAAPEVKALKEGDLDIAYLCAIPLIVPISDGLDAKIVAAVNMNGSSLVFRPGLNYSGPQSLRGLSIGTFPPLTAQDILLKKWLFENGINISEVKLIPMGPGDAVAAISAGEVDAVFLPSPAEAIIELTGKGKTVLSSGEMWPDGHGCCVIAASGNLSRDNPKLVEQIVKTNTKATEYANAHPDEVAKIYSNRTGQDPKMIDYSIKTWDGRWISNPHDLIKSILEIAKFEYKNNYTQKELTEKDLFDTSFYRK